MPDSTNQNEVLTEVLNVTRDHLSRAMNLNAELEALLLIERKKTKKLEDELNKTKKEEKP